MDEKARQRFEDKVKQVVPEEKLDLQLDEMNKGADTHLRKIGEKVADPDKLTDALKLEHLVFIQVQKKHPNDPRSQG